MHVVARLDRRADRAVVEDQPAVGVATDGPGIAVVREIAERAPAKPVARGLGVTTVVAVNRAHDRVVDPGLAGGSHQCLVRMVLFLHPNSLRTIDRVGHGTVHCAQGIHVWHAGRVEHRADEDRVKRCFAVSVCVGCSRGISSHPAFDQSPGRTGCGKIPYGSNYEAVPGPCQGRV